MKSIIEIYEEKNSRSAEENPWKQNRHGRLQNAFRDQIGNESEHVKT